jgi:hypothetical protein
MTVPNRMTVKFFVHEAEGLDPAAFIPLFHRWIREGTVEGLLIDVADYRHVPGGPAVILVGHEVDYVLDLGGGRAGLLARLKRGAADDLAARLQTLLQLALQACAAISSEPALDGRVSFDLGRLEVAFPDRLNTPNCPEAVAAVQPTVQAVLDAFYGHTAVRLKQMYKDGRWPLTLSAQVQTSNGQQLTVNN